MAKKQDARTLMRKQLGKDVADAMLNKVDSLAKKGATPAQIEKAFYADLTAHIENQVVSAVLVKIGPTPIAVKPIQNDIKSRIATAVNVIKIGPITPIKVTPSSVGVKVGPGTYTKGSK